MAKQQSTGAYIARLTLTLLIIAAVCAGLLGLVNAITCLLYTSLVTGHGLHVFRMNASKKRMSHQIHLCF